MSRWHVLVEPTVPILLLASVVHVVRQNAFDFLLFFGTAVVIVVDAGRRGRRSPISAPSAAHDDIPGPRRHWVAVALVAAFALVVAWVPIGSGLMQVVLAVVGVAALAVVVMARPVDGAAPVPRRARAERGWPAWAVVGVVACLWELTSFIFQQASPTTEYSHPAASDLIEPLLAPWVGRVVFLALWGGAGWWLLRRLSDAATSAHHASGSAGRSEAPR